MARKQKLSSSTGASDKPQSSNTGNDAIQRTANVKHPAASRGPKPEIAPHFEGTFEEAIDTALSKKRPAGGWPKHPIK